MTSKSTNFENYFNDMAIPRLIVQKKGKNFIISEINQLALRYFGKSEAPFKNMEIQEIMDAANAQHFQQSFEVCYSRKQSVTVQALPGVPSEVKIYGFFISPVMNDKGDIEFLDMIGQLDLTDQSILQRERDDAISMLTSVFEVGEIGIIVTDNKGIVARVNESFIRTYGWQRDELVQSPFTDLVTPDERDIVKKIATKSRQSWTLPCVNAWKNLCAWRKTKPMPPTAQNQPSSRI